MIGICNSAPAYFFPPGATRISRFRSGGQGVAAVNQVPEISHAVIGERMTHFIGLQ
jgi:hypothetical protein